MRCCDWCSDVCCFDLVFLKQQSASEAAGMDLKKSPSINLQRERIPSLLSSSFEFIDALLTYSFLALSIACGKSNSMPCRLGLFFRIVDKNIPCPPPISTTVLNCEKSYMEEIDETCNEVSEVIALLN